MKLSEAMRLGAMLLPQAFSVWYETDPISGVATASCALGAAEHGGFNVRTLMGKGPRDLCCPVCGHQGGFVYLVGHVNDTHRWTREAIADWVEIIELERQPADASATATNAVREDCESPVLTTRA